MTLDDTLRKGWIGDKCFIVTVRFKANGHQIFNIECPGAPTGVQFYLLPTDFRKRLGGSEPKQKVCFRSCHVQALEPPMFGGTMRYWNLHVRSKKVKLKLIQFFVRVPESTAYSCSPKRVTSSHPPELVEGNGLNHLDLLGSCYPNHPLVIMRDFQVLYCSRHGFDAMGHQCSPEPQSFLQVLKLGEVFRSH